MRAVLTVLTLLCALLGGAAHAETRLALVIGNAEYEQTGWRLTNPVKDARAVAAALSGEGFTVTKVENATRDGMTDAVRAFRGDVKAAVTREGAAEVVVLVYYAGHGLQDTTGVNYLPGIDLDAQFIQDVPGEALRLGFIVDQLSFAGAGANFLIVNACRDVPLASAYLSGEAGKGMNREAAPSRVLIAYGAQPGTTARDYVNPGDPVSPFAAALLSRLAAGGAAYDVLADAAAATVTATGGAQRPVLEYTPDPQDRIRQVWFGVPAPGAAASDAQTKAMVDAAREASLREAAARIEAADREAALRRQIAELEAAARERDTSDAYERARDELATAVSSRDAASAEFPRAPARATPEPSAPAATGRAPGDEFRDCADCPVMVVVPAGSFTMGSPASEAGRNDNEGPQRTVTIPRAFAVGKFEVTFDEWDACVRGGGCGGHTPSDAGSGKASRPVINVSWDDAQAYVRWLSSKTGEDYRLLSEAEWEYAARAGSQARWSFGDDEARLGAHAWYSSNAGRKTQPVGGKAANDFGLHDMHGNVWEWVEDCYAIPLCSTRVVRGGSRLDVPESVRSAKRASRIPDNRLLNLGVRLARSLED